MQTSLGRTDIVRWFKDHRSALKNGETLDWMEGFQGVTEKQKASQEQNGQSSEKNKCISLEIKAVKGKFWRRTWSSVIFFLFFTFL